VVVFQRLADLADNRRRWVLVGTVVFVLVAGVFGGPVAGLLSGGGSNFEDADSESVRAREQVEQAAGANPEPGMIVLVSPGEAVRSGSGRDEVEAVARDIADDPAVGRVSSFYNTNDEAFVSRDGRSTYLVVSFKPLPEKEVEDAAARIQDALAENENVTFGGGEVAGEQIGEQVGEDLARAELLVLPILFLASLFVFRGVVAALLPLLAGVVSIVSTFLVLRLVNEATTLSIYALNLVTGLGLGLAIDYSLFIVSRYREELERVGHGREALRRTLTTAGRTVAYSSLTVAIAIASLLVFPQPFLYSMGIGGLVVALLSGVTALVVLPAILAALGPRVNALAPTRWRRATEATARGEQRGFWYRLSHWVMRRPIPVATVTAALLLAAGAPFLRVEFTGVDASVLPESASARQVDDALAADFPPDRGSPILVAVEAPRSAASAVERYTEDVRGLDGVAAVSDPQPVGGELWRLDVISAEGPLDQTTQDLVREIRALEPPFDVSVGGYPAVFRDNQGSILSHLPIAIAILAVGTLALLFFMTGSVTLPLKALVMNLLTVSAAFGIAVVIFQDGNLQGLLDFRSQGALESTQPVLIFVMVFALSTDYAVFLLTRIKEARDAGASNTEAVATGLERTGRIVTAAALLFAIAIGAFSTSEIVFIKLIGVATALAVLIDSSIIRALLVPSLMKLMGEWNWWAPGPLRRLHERFGLREGEATPTGA
jgi:uncharacterized membrane protein YdfJ with MMPL/SSD domain